MTTDAWLAVIHHVAVFGLLAVLAAEWGLVRPGLSAEGAVRVARIDAAYGAFAGVVLAAGVARLVWGEQPFDYYDDQPFFWLKMAAFATVGLLSIAPTMRYLRWRSRRAAARRRGPLRPAPPPPPAGDLPAHPHRRRPDGPPHRRLVRGFAPPPPDDQLLADANEQARSRQVKAVTVS